jgi:hypothetical protein
MEPFVTPERSTHFDLGFEHGIEATEEPSDLEMSSRVPDFRLGYIVGRSYSVCVRRGNRADAARVAGELAARFDVKLEALLEALGVTADNLRVIRDAFEKNNPLRAKPTMY